MVHMFTLSKKNEAIEDGHHVNTNNKIIQTFPDRGRSTSNGGERR